MRFPSRTAYRPGVAIVWAACLMLAVSLLTACQFIPGTEGSDDVIEVGVLPLTDAPDDGPDPVGATPAPAAPGDEPPAAGSPSDAATPANDQTQDPSTATNGPPPPDPVAPFFAAEQAACLARGGMYQRVGQSDVRACIFATQDAGRSCTSSAACEGMCLARSGTCAPVTPLYGCHEIVQNNGLRTTQCLQ